MLPNRRPAEHFTVGPFVVTVGFNPNTGSPCEVFISSRGKSGTQLDNWLYELGVTTSKIMQGERYIKPPGKHDNEVDEEAP